MTIESLDQYDISLVYPQKMFDLFGMFSHLNMTHFIFNLPNVQLTASDIQLKVDPTIEDFNGKILVLKDKHEVFMHPFTGQIVHT